MTAPVALFWMAGEDGFGLLGMVIGVGAAWLHAVIGSVWNEYVADLWVRILSGSITAALPAPFIAESPAVRRLLEVLDQVIRMDATVLIEGETGSGKELVARTIHTAGRRRHGPFVPVNCAVIPDGLANREVFGHDRGAFTGALQGQGLPHPGVEGSGLQDRRPDGARARSGTTLSRLRFLGGRKRAQFRRMVWEVLTGVALIASGAALG